MKEQSANFRAMVKRKGLVRMNTPAADEKAEKILQAVEKNGGLSAEEVYALMAY